MLDRILDSKKLIYKSLDAAWKQNEAIAQNLANVNTPGYKRKMILFEDQLRAAMENDNFSKSDVDQIEIKAVQDNSTSTRMDGNNVNPDVEMVELAKNSIKYNALIEQAGFKKILMALRDGR